MKREITLKRDDLGYAQTNLSIASREKVVGISMDSVEWRPESLSLTFGGGREVATYIRREVCCKCKEKGCLCEPFNIGERETQDEGIIFDRYDNPIEHSSLPENCCLVQGVSVNLPWYISGPLEFEA